VESVSDHTTFVIVGGGLAGVGLHDPDDELIIRGSLDDARFQAFWIAADGSVSAAMHVNDWDAIEPIRALLETGATVDARRLSDPDQPLADERKAA
jgi:3-phenylpropionate/trans-cinnamate dioxygenase ferredoxin reductase subunit